MRYITNHLHHLNHLQSSNKPEQQSEENTLTKTPKKSQNRSFLKIARKTILHIAGGQLPKTKGQSLLRLLQAVCAVVDAAQYASAKPFSWNFGYKFWKFKFRNFGINNGLKKGKPASFGEMRSWSQTPLEHFPERSIKWVFSSPQ